MFATLVVVLPGDYSGGELVIRHRGQEVRVDLHREEPSEAAFAAFYADCVHEVLPIASGYRLALIYNLVRRGPGPLPQAPDYSAEQARLTQLLAGWASRDPGPDAGPDKLVYPLEHAYSEAEVAFDTLKGKDAAVAQVLVPAADGAGCDLHLALISVLESGWAEYTGGGRWDDPELEIGEVTDSDWSIHDWRLPDGGRPEMGPLPFAEAELAPPDALSDLDQTEAEFSEATGNEGASFERHYQRAALILWPRNRRARVLAAGGLAVSVPALLALVQRWEAAGAKAEDDLWHQARALAAAIRDGWPQESWSRRRASEDRRTRDLFAVQLRLGDLEGCIDFIARHAAAGAYGAADNPALAAVLGQLPADQAARLLSALISGNVAQVPGACADLLARCSGGEASRLPALRAPALALIQGLPDGPETARLPDGQRPEPMTPAHVVAALAALARIDGDIADRALGLFLSRPAIYDLDRVLLPAALLLKESAADPEPPTVAKLRGLSWRTWRRALPCPWSRRAIGPGRPRSRAAAATARGSLDSSPRPRSRPGTSRPPRRSAIMWRRR